MKQNTEHESKIFTPNRSTNERKNEPNEPGVSDIEPGGSLLKKNEFTMILLAALAVTALVFIFFFRGSSTRQEAEKTPAPAGGTEQAVPGFEDRISALEISLAKLASSSNQNETQASSRAVSNLDERTTRIERALNLKLDTLIERVDKLEGRLNKLAVVASTPPPKTVVTPTVEQKKPAVPVPEKKVQVIKKKAEKTNKSSQFHTVQKGETLWSISRKYNNSVAAIRKLNNLKPEDKIYPGINLLVK